MTCSFENLLGSMRMTSRIVTRMNMRGKQEMKWLSRARIPIQCNKHATEYPP